MSNDIDGRDRARVAPEDMDRDANARLAHELGYDGARHRVIAVETAFVCLRRIDDRGPMADTFWAPRRFAGREPAELPTRVGVLHLDPSQPGRHAAIANELLHMEMPSEYLRIGETAAQAASRALARAGVKGQVAELLIDSAEAFPAGSVRLVIFAARAPLDWSGVRTWDLRNGDFAWVLDRAIDALPEDERAPLRVVR